MIRFIVRFVHDFLWDEAFAQRMIAGLCYYGGGVLAAGGVIYIPFKHVEVTIPWLSGWYGYGLLIQAVGLSLATGSTLAILKERAAARRAEPDSTSPTPSTSGPASG